MLARPPPARAVELVGPSTSLFNASGFELWRNDECSAAHTLKHAASDYDVWASGELDDDGVRAWQRRIDDRVVPLFATSSVVSHDPVAHGELVASLWNFTGVTATLVEDTDDCTVMSLTWASFDGFEFKYVHNKRAAVGAHSIADYDAYVEAAHARYLVNETASSADDAAGGEDEDSRLSGWDHWLDQHLGFEFQTLGDECAVMDGNIRSVLRRDAVPAAERRTFETLTDFTQNYTTHFYTGYKGSLTWEFNVQCSTDASAPDVCTCISSNNDADFFAKTGETCTDASALDGEAAREKATAAAAARLR